MTHVWGLWLRGKFEALRERREVVLWILGLVGVLAVVVVSVSLVPLPLVLAVARFLGLLAIGHLIWMYHRLADWSVVPVGRSTMAIKGAIFFMAVTANMRTLESWDQLLVHTLDLSALACWAEIGIVFSWLAMTAGCLQRTRLVTQIQRRHNGVAVVPVKPAIWPVEERREDEV